MIVETHIDPQLQQERFVQEFLRFVRTKNICQEGDKLLLAVSGGLDSTVLMHVFSRVQRLLGISLAVVHVDHRSRGMASEREGVWVKVLAEQLGLSTHTLSLPEEIEKASQEHFRNARRSLLLQLLREQGASHIATAHHANDNAETFLMRAMSGSGVRGLAGMAPREGLWTKPLLWATREDLEAYARQHGLAWVEDPSNSRGKYLRNRVRLEVLPLMDELREAATRNVARVASRVEEEEVEWAAWIEQQLDAHQENGSPEVLSRAWIEKWPRPLQRRIFWQWMRRLHLEADAAAIETLLRGEECVVAQGSFLNRSDMLVFTREQNFGAAWSGALLSVEVTKRVALGPSMAWSFLASAPQKLEPCALSFYLLFRQPDAKKRDTHALAWEKLPWPLALRAAEPQERRVFERLKRAGIPKPYYARWPLLVSEADPSVIVAVVGVCVSKEFEVSAGERCVCIDYFYEKLASNPYTDASRL